MRETFADRLDDEEDDASDEAIPLLPLDGPAREAMEDHAFLKFIAEMGLAPPANEQVAHFNRLGIPLVSNVTQRCSLQEQYWRIPVALKARHLRTRIDYLEKSMAAPGRTESSSAAGDDSLRTGSRSSSRASGTSGKRSASPPLGSSANTKRRRIVQSDSEEDGPAPRSIDAGADIDAPESAAASTKASRKRLAILDSDSE